MQDDNSYIEIIQQLIAEGDLDNAFDSFREFLHVSIRSEKIKTEGLLLVSSYKKLKKENLLGIASDAETKFTKLCHSLLVFIQDLNKTSIKKAYEENLNEKLGELRRRFLQTTNIVELELIQHEGNNLINLYPESFEASQFLRTIDNSISWHQEKLTKVGRQAEVIESTYPSDRSNFILMLVLLVGFFLLCLFIYKRCNIFDKDNAKVVNNSNKNDVNLLISDINIVPQVDFDSISNLMASYFLMDSILYLDLLDSLTNNDKHDLAIAAFESTLQKTLRKDKIKNANDYIKSLKLAQERGFDRVYWDFPSTNNLILTEKNDKFGLFSNKGDEIIPPKYDEINPLLFSTLIAITLDDNFGFLNAQGIEVIPPVLSDILPLEGTNLILVEENQQFGAIDTFGKILIPIKYGLLDLPDDFGYIRVKQYDKWGFLDSKGKNVIPIKFDTISPFIKNVAFSRYNGDVRYINRKGAFVKNPIFE